MGVGERLTLICSVSWRHLSSLGHKATRKLPCRARSSPELNESPRPGLGLGS